jgi:hypothetical protein
MLTPKRIVVNSSCGEELSAGEKFHFEVQGQGEVALFTATLAGVSGNLAEFELTSKKRSVPTAADMRLKVRDLVATVQDAGQNSQSAVETATQAALPAQEIDCHVVDLSNQGLGLLAPQAIPSGAALHLTLHTPLGPVNCQTAVRYCKAEGDAYRLGLLIKSMDRLDRGRYSFFLQSLAS